jgi:hypothetical protein
MATKKAKKAAGTRITVGSENPQVLDIKGRTPLTVRLDQETALGLEEFMWAVRKVVGFAPTVSVAIRELVRRGLTVAKKEGEIGRYMEAVRIQADPPEYRKVIVVPPEGLPAKPGMRHGTARDLRNVERRLKTTPSSVKTP